MPRTSIKIIQWGKDYEESDEDEVPGRPGDIVYGDLSYMTMGINLARYLPLRHVNLRYVANRYRVKGRAAEMSMSLMARMMDSTRKMSMSLKYKVHILE